MDTWIHGYEGGGGGEETGGGVVNEFTWEGRYQHVSLRV